MAKPRKPVVDYIVYLVVRVVTMFLHMYRAETLYNYCTILGNFFFRIDRRHREIIFRHLRQSFPEWSEKQISTCAREAFGNLFKLGFETLLTPRRMTLNGWRKHIRFANMAPVLQRLLEHEKGIIMVTGHFGNWEISGYVMALLGFPSVAVARPLDNPHLNEFIMGVREQTGLSVLYKTGATMSMDEVLQSKGTLCFIADQDAGRKGTFVDFFGRPASTYRSVALMACRHKVPVVVGYAKRLSDKYEFEMGVQRVIEPHEWEDKENPLYWVTATFTKELENIIRTAPGQYLWAHRRWKHRPDGTKE